MSQFGNGDDGTTRPPRKSVFDRIAGTDEERVMSSTSEDNARFVSKEQVAAQTSADLKRQEEFQQRLLRQAEMDKRAAENPIIIPTTEEEPQASETPAAVDEGTVDIDSVIPSDDGQTTITKTDIFGDEISANVPPINQMTENVSTDEDILDGDVVAVEAATITVDGAAPQVTHQLEETGAIIPPSQPAEDAPTTPEDPQPISEVTPMPEQHPDASDDARSIVITDEDLSVDTATDTPAKDIDQIINEASSGLVFQKHEVTTGLKVDVSGSNNHEVDSSIIADPIKEEINIGSVPVDSNILTTDVNTADISTSNEPRTEPEPVKELTEDEYRDQALVQFRKRMMIPFYTEEEAARRYTELRRNTERYRAQLRREGYEDDEISVAIVARYGEDLIEAEAVDEFYSNQQSLNTEALTNALNRKQVPAIVWTDENGKQHRDTNANSSYLNKFDSTDVVIRGSSARTIVAALTSGVKRVWLANSGFYLNLKGPSQTDLDDFYRTIHREAFEHGKTFGQYYFFPCDTDIKTYLMGMLGNWVINSNLRDWSVGNTLISNISYQDYDTILWAIATLLHPRGITLDFKCDNLQCPKPLQPIKIDLEQLKFVNFDAMPIKAKNYLFSTAEKSSEELTEYRDSLMLHTKKHLAENWYGKMKVPTMAEHLAYSSEFNAELAMRINREEERDVARYLAYARYQFFAPWISQLIYEYGDPKNPKQACFEDDIAKSLEDIQASLGANDAFFNSCKSYIADTKLTHIGYPYDVCPCCNKPISSAVGGIIPCDVQTTFFSMSVMKLNFQ